MKKGYLILCISFLLSGCVHSTPPPTDETVHVPELSIQPYTKGQVPEVKHMLTTNKIAHLTFNGLLPDEQMIQLLELLASQSVQVTFFIEGNDVAENPELIQQILKQGHEVELLAVSGEEADYSAFYTELKKGKEIFERFINQTPRFVRMQSGNFNEALNQAASTLAYDAVIGEAINPKASNDQSSVEISNYIEKFVNRGAVILLHLNPDQSNILEAIQQTNQKINNKSYQLVALDEAELPKNIESTIPLLQKNKKHDLFYSQDTQEKQVALTFDDWGTDADVERILDELDLYSVKSTFFIIGERVEANPNLARLIIERGHEVASHSYAHHNLTTLSKDEIVADLTRAEEVLNQVTQGQQLEMMRPPEGAINPTVIEAIKEVGYRYTALFDVSSFDWNKELSDQQVMERVLTRITPGSVIVFHIQDAERDTQIVPHVIEQLTTKGYHFVKMSEWLNFEEE